MTGKCRQKPVVQVFQIYSRLIVYRNGKQWHVVLLSDGSFRQVGLIAHEFFISNKLQEGAILRLTNFHPYNIDSGNIIIRISDILVSGLIVVRRKCGIIGDPEPLPENEDHVEEPPTSKQKQDHVEEPPTSKLKQDHVDSLQNENIDDSRHVDLTSGAISKIMTCKCTQNDLKPVLQLTYADSGVTSSRNGKQWYWVGLSDGSFIKFGFIPDEIFISNKLQTGSIVQLTNFQPNDIDCGNIHVSEILVSNLIVIHRKCGIIGDPEPLPENEDHVEEPPTSKQKQDHVDSHLNENIDDSRHVEEPPTSQQKQDHVDSHLNENIDDSRHVEESPTSKQKQDHVDSHLNENIDDSRHVEEPPTSQQKQDHVDSHLNENIDDSRHVEEPPTSKQKQDHVDSHLNENIDDSRHVEEPPTSKQKPSASTQECPFHSLTQNKTNTIIGVDLTPGAITKIMTDKCSSTDLKPVVQVTNILSGWISTQNDKRCYKKVVLSDGSSSHFGCIADDIFISNKLLKGSTVQLTKFHFSNYYGNIRVLLINDVNMIHSKCDIIVNPEPFPHNDIPLVGRSTQPITHEDHVDVRQAQEPVTSTQNCSETQSRKRKHQSSNEPPEPDTIEHVDNSHSAQEPSATTQRCSSHSLTRSKKRKHHSSNNRISKVVSKMVRMMIEKNNKEDDVGSCCKKLETLEKDISKMTRTMMKKNKEVDVGFKKLEGLKEDVSKMMRVMMEKSKEDDVGACFKRLGVIEEDISKLTRMVMEKNKEDDVGACFKKLETLEEDVSELTRMMMEKNKEDIVGLKKLETLEQDVSKLTRMMMEKNNEDVGACYRKLERLEEDVAKLTRLMMENNKDDDMGACIEKLDKMGWGAEEPIYETALLLFGQSADYRKLWLHLKPECCGKWVKNAGNMFGLLD